MLFMQLLCIWESIAITFCTMLDSIFVRMVHIPLCYTSYFI